MSQTIMYIQSSNQLVIKNIFKVYQLLICKNPEPLYKGTRIIDMSRDDATGIPKERTSIVNTPKEDMADTGTRRQWPNPSSSM